MSKTTQQTFKVAADDSNYDPAPELLYYAHPDFHTVGYNFRKNSQVTHKKIETIWNNIQKDTTKYPKHDLDVSIRQLLEMREGKEHGLRDEIAQFFAHAVIQGLRTMDDVADLTNGCLDADDLRSMFIEFLNKDLQKNIPQPKI